MIRKLLIISLALASIGFAQRSKGGGGGAPSMSPGGSAPSNKFEMICADLNLNKDQKKAAKTVLDEAAKEATPLREQMSKARIAIADGIQAKKGNDDLKAGVEAYAALAAQMSSLEINAFAKIFASLDETQKQNKSAIAQVFGMMKYMFATKNWNDE
jgi:Heavy-metal resistance